MEEWLEQLLADLSKGEKTEVLFKKYKQLNGDVGMLNKIKAVGMLRQRPGYDTDKAISSVLGEDFKKKYLAQVKPAVPTATAVAVAEPQKKLTQADFGGDPLEKVAGVKRTTPTGTTTAIAATPDEKKFEIDPALQKQLQDVYGEKQPVDIPGITKNGQFVNPTIPKSNPVTDPIFDAAAEVSNAPDKEFTGRTVAKTIWTENGYVTVPYDYEQPINRFEPLPQMTQFKSGDIRKNAGSRTGYEVFRYDRDKGAWGWTPIVKPAKISGWNDEVVVKAIKPKLSKEEAASLIEEKTKTDKPFKDYLELAESDILKRKLAGNPTLAKAVSEEINKAPTKAKTGDGRLEVYQNAVAKNYKLDVDPFKAFPSIDPPEFTKFMKRVKDFDKVKALSNDAKNLAAKYKVNKSPKTLEEYNAIVDKMQEYKPLLDFFARKDVSDILHLMALQDDGQKEMASALNYFPGYREKVNERENKKLEEEGGWSGAGKSFAKGTLNLIVNAIYGGIKMTPGLNLLGQLTGADDMMDKYKDNYDQWASATFQTGRAKNDFLSFVNGALETAPQVIGIMLTRNPALGQAVFMAAPAFGSSYSESLTQGLSKPAAYAKAVVDAGIEVATEQIVNDHNLAKGFRPSKTLSDLGAKGFHTPEFKKLFTKELGTYIATRPYRFAKEYTGQLTEEVSAMVLGRMSNSVANALSGSEFQTKAVGDEEKNLAGSMALITLGMKTIGRNWQGGKAQGYRSIILKNAVDDFDGAMAIVESLKADPDVHPKLIQQIENDLTKLATLKFNKNSSPEQQVVLVDELKKLKELQDEKENTEKALHEPIDEKIKEQQLKITSILGSPKAAQAMFDKQIQSALDDLQKHGDKQGGAYVEAALKLTGKTMDDWWKEKVNAVNYRADLTPEEKEKEKDRIMEEHGKWLVARHAEEGKEVFTDFDDTVAKNGKLTPLGEELKKRAAAGEKVTVLTAREDTPENRKYIAGQLGIPEENVKLGLDAKGKAALLTEGSTYYNENTEELEAGRGVKGVTVVDTNIGTAAPVVLGEPTITKVDDGELYEFKTKDGLIGGVMLSPTEFRIDGVAASEVGKGKGTRMFEGLINYLRDKGVTKISTISAGEGATAMHDKAVEKGLLKELKKDERSAEYEILPKPVVEKVAIVEPKPVITTTPVKFSWDNLSAQTDDTLKEKLSEVEIDLQYEKDTGELARLKSQQRVLKETLAKRAEKPAPVEEKPPVEQEEKEKPDPDRPGVASEQFTRKNITTINAIAETHPNWKVRKLYKAAAGAIRTWSKLKPNMAVTLHHSREEFAKEVLSDPNGTKEDAYGARGFYVSNKGIHINVPAVLKRNVADEVFHEAAHPVLDMIVKNNPAALDKHFNELLGLEDVLPGVGRAIDFGVEGDVYKGAEKKKEAIIQFMTMVADREISLEALSPSALDRVGDFIKRFLNSIGFNYELKVGINQADSLVDVARKFSYAIQKGRALRFNAKPIKSNGETVAVNITLPKQWSKGEAITNTKEGVKQIDPRTLAGQDVTVIPSDRLHADSVVNEESGKKHDAAGGVFYPHKTGLAWATGKVTGINNIVKNLRFDKDGLANIGIMIMGKDSHMSNVNSFEYALDSIEGAVRTGKVTIADVIDKTNKALNTKGVADQLGEPFKVSGGISKVIRMLGENFMVNEANFQARKAFLESMLGKTIIEGKTSLWGGVPTFNEVSDRLEEPAVKNVPSNHLVAVIKVSKDVSLQEVPEEDDRFHRSYPAPMGAKQVEFYLFNSSVPLPVFAPEMRLSGAGGEGKVLKWENYKETYKEEGEAYALEKYGRQVRLHPKTVTVPAKMQFSKGEINYDKWKGKNREVSGRAIQDVKTGEPIVAKVYHGTTHEFYEFDSSKKGNVEGHLGKINYFTSDYDDASTNYLSGGADITNRIDNVRDHLEQQLEDYTNKSGGLAINRIKKDFGITSKELKTLGDTKDIGVRKLSRYIAEKQLMGGDEKVLELYVKLNNPMVLGDKATWAEVIPESEYADSLEEAAQEIADENGIDIEEAKGDHSYEIRDRAIEMSGAESKVHSALEDALRENGYDSSKAMEILGDHMFETEVDLNRLEKQIRKHELYENREGKMASSQVITDFFKNLGHDGIILTDVSKRFIGMRLETGTSHVHVFDEYANQIKLSDGSNVEFGATNDIRFSKGEYGKRLDKAVSKLITEGSLPIELKNEYTALRKLEMTRGKLNKEYMTNVGKFIDTMKKEYGEKPDKIIDLLHKVMPKAPTVKTEVQELFDGSKSSAEIISGVGEMVNDPYLNKSIETLLPYLKANPQIKFNKLFSIGKGEAHYTGDWTVLLSEIENKKDLAHVAVHELYHAISVNGILANKEFAGRINAIIEEARKKMGLEKYFEKAENTDFSYTKDVRLYGLLNNSEFVAELFSNEDFAKLLDKHKVQGDRSFLDKVIDAIRKLVGLPERAYSEKIKESILKDLPHKIDLMRDPLSLQVVQNYRWAAKEEDFKYAGRDAEAIQYSKGEPQVYISKSDVKKASDWGKEINVLKNENTILEGQFVDKKDLPKEIYHVTTKAPLISASGMIKHIPAESKAAGLGKGTSKQHWGVSLTTNRKTAALIERDLSRMVELANVGDGDATQIFRRIANEDSQLTGVDLKDVADETIKLIEWRKSHGQGKNAAFNEFKYQYLTARQRAGGGENPIFFGDAEAFKQINPDDIGIIKVKSSDIPSEALIRKHPLGSNHLDEVMVHSDIPVESAEQMQYSKGVDETKKALDKLDTKQLQKLIDIKEQDEDLPYQDSPGRTPDVNYHVKDLQDSVEGKYGVNEKSIAKDYDAPKDALIYTGEIPMDEMPSPVLAEREDGGEATYDWSEMQGRPKNMPPAKVRIEKDGTIKILDGNHRIEFWSEQGYDNVPAWIIDERKTDSKGLAEAYHAAKELDEDEREESHDELIKAVEDVVYPMQFSKGGVSSGMQTIQSTAKALEQVAKTNPDALVKMPNVTWHGSKNKNLIFGTPKEGKASVSKMQLDFGTHFTTEDYAQFYEGDKGKRYPAIIDLKKPLDLTQGVWWKDDPNYDKVFELIKDLKLEKAYGSYDYYDKDGNKQAEIQNISINAHKLNSIAPKKVSDALKKNGFDGIIYEPYHPAGMKHYEAKPKSYIVLDNAAIKEPTPQNISEAYHKAKEDGSNPELVKAVEEVVAPMQFSKGTSKKRDPLLQAHLDNIRSLVKADLKGSNATNTQKVKAVKEVIADKIKQMINDGIERKVFKGDVKASLLASVIKRLNATESPYSMLQFVDYLGKMMDNVEYEGDLQQANKIRKKIKSAIKSKVRDADKLTKDMVEAFVRVRPDNVSDIHDYIAIANRVLTAATGIKVRSNATGVSVKNPFLEISHKELTDYTQDQQELADEQAAQRIADMHQELVDNDVIDAKAMTAREMIDIIKSISGSDEKAIADAKQQIAEDRDNKMGALKAVADYQRHALMEIVQDNTVALTPKEKETVRRLLKIDLETLTGIQLAKYIDVVNNILVNNNFVGAGDIAIQSKMREDAAVLREKLKGMGVNMKEITNWAVKSLSSQALFFGFLTKLDAAAAEIQRLIGISGVQSGNARARDIQLKAVAGYDKLKKGMSSDINSALNRYRRGVYADVMNNFGGTAAEQKVEFERRVGWIKESARLLRESSVDREQREARILDHIIDELLEGSETQDDVKTKMQVIEPDNIRLVKYWQDTYRDRWDAVKENAEIFNNRTTEDVDNYTATMLKGVDNKNAQTDREIDINAQTFISQNLKLNPAGTKITKVRSKTPPPDRVLNLDFDYVQSKKYFETNYDVETAEHILQAKAFLESDEAVDLLGGTGNVKLVAQNLQKSIALQRGQRLFQDESVTKEIKFWTDWIHRKSTRLALLSLVQWGKQYFSILPNTIINLGKDMDLLAKAYTVGVNDELYNLYNISQRGATRAGFTKMVEPAEIEEAFLNNNFMTALRYINKKSEALTDLLAKSLVKGDVRIARRSWMAFYMQGLRKQGIEVWNRDMDQEHLQPNDEAAAYAEQMVSKNQNPNDPSSMANLHRQSNDQWFDMIKNVALPFSTFPMNMRMRMTNDVQKLRYGTAKGRLEAGRSLIATAVEQFIFNYFKVYWIGQASTWAAAQLANAMGLHGGAGGDDDEAKKDKEEEAKLKKRWLANSISDLFFSGMGTGVQTGFQEGANMLHQLTTPPKLEFSVEKNKLIKVYADDWYYMPNKKLIDHLGIYGIAPKKIIEVWKDGKMAFTKETEKYLERSYGDHPQTEMIKLTDKEQWVMIYLFCAGALGLAGLSDAEVKVMNSRLRKTTKDQLAERAGKKIENTDVFIPPKKQ